MNLATGCSGIGAPDLAALELGWNHVFACENAAFPRAVLEHRFGYGTPGGPPLLEDFLAIEAADFPETECFIAGTPCQSFSMAGKREGLADDRGNLTLKFVELCHDFQDTARNFRWALWENVPGVLSDKGNAFGIFISALVGGHAPALPPGSRADDFTPEAQEEIRDGYRKRPPSWPGAGMVEGPRARLAWRILDAQYFGVPQRRRRVFVVVSFGDGDPAKVLFELRSRNGNHPPRRKKGKGIAAATLRSTDGGCDVDHAAGGQLVAEKGFVPEIVPQAISSKWAKGSSGPAGDEVANLVAFETAHALTGKGHDASEDGTGRGTPIIPIDMRQASRGEKITNNRTIGSGGAPGHGIGNPGDPAFTVSERGQAVAFSCKDSGADAGEIAPTLRAMSESAGAQANGGGQVAVAFAIQERAGAVNPNAGPDGKGFQEEQAFTIEARAVPQSVATSFAVRRLTPRECERCQGFPDDWTLIPNWTAKRPGWKEDLLETARWILGDDAAGETPEEMAARWQEAQKLAAHPDGPRYKAIGNSWAYPVGLWIMRRMDAEDKRALSATG